MSNLQVRIISAVVLAAIVLSVTWFGAIAFRLLAAAIGAAMLYEWLTMARPVSDATNRLLAWLALALSLVLLLLAFPAWLCFAALGAGVVLTAGHARFGAHRQWPAAGLAYAGLSALSLALLRGSDLAGLKAILFLFAVVWATDIAAYFVGRAVGGPKLAPTISPGKTRSGAFGGAVGGVIAGVAMIAMLGGANLAFVALLALLLSILAQAGDLFESWVKRRHGAKDSSRLIPGHGGVMDRVDGLVVAALALYLIGAASGGMDHPTAVLFGG
jgi:phosphatidate cytidylyltransferase